MTADVSPLALTALVCTGATGTFLVAGFLRGGTDLGFAPAGWFWLGALALVSTVGAILLFFAGMARVGPSVASILSILEPVVTVIGGGRGVRRDAHRGPVARRARWCWPRC